MKEPLSQGAAPGGPTGRWLTSTTSPATLWRILPWSTSIFMKKEHYEEFNIKRKHFWAALRPQQCLQNVTFDDYSGANQWRHAAVHETVVLKRSGLLVHLKVSKRTIFCATSRWPTAGSGRGWRRPSLLRIIYSAKCEVYMKRNKYAKFHYAVILSGFSAIVFVNFKKRASIPLASCTLVQSQSRWDAIEHNLS